MLLTNEIHLWVNSLILPKLELNNLPICPYARQALNLYSVDECTYDNIEDKISNCDIHNHKVCIFYFNEYRNYDVSVLEDKTKELNLLFNHKDIIVLDNEPRMPFVINNIKTTFDHSYLWLVQPLNELKIKSTELKEKTSYYTFWTKEQLDEVVNWR